MHDSYCLYSLSHSAMVEISVMLISTILLCDILLLLFLLLFLYMLTFFYICNGPCVCNKDILYYYNSGKISLKKKRVVRFPHKAIDICVKRNKKDFKSSL